jgi:hypothetical protein
MSRCQNNTALYSTGEVTFFHHGFAATAGIEAEPTTEIIMPAKRADFRR